MRFGEIKCHKINKDNLIWLDSSNNGGTLVIVYTQSEYWGIVYPQSKHWWMCTPIQTLGDSVPQSKHWGMCTPCPTVIDALDEHFITNLLPSGEQGICILWLTLISFCNSSHSLLVAHSHDVLIASTTQATDSNWVREPKMPPAEQIHRLDPGQRADKDHWTQPTTF